VKHPVRVDTGCQGESVVPSMPSHMPVDDLDATEFHVYCPYCGEDLEISLEPELQGTLVMDCEVCCRPWQVHITRDSECRYVEVTRGDGSE
jgi:hypothetical protein